MALIGGVFVVWQVGAAVARVLGGRNGLYLNPFLPS
ncbi:hypothetical protein Ga0466249_004754 [Sporomusaceae bacterium BoRhaA]|nr:hypothetical protein [Pelorhabdus rhamnosifermentans]